MKNLIITSTGLLKVPDNEDRFEDAETIKKLLDNKYR